MTAPKKKPNNHAAVLIWDDTNKAYKVWDGVLTTGDIQIGAVEIKDHDSDTRADVITCDGHNGLVTLSPGHVSTDNSTSTPLSADATYTGTWEDILNFGIIVITLKADQASATDGLMVEFSSDGTNVDSSDVFTIPANTGKTFSFQAATQYFRVKYTNGGSDQTAFRLQTILKPYYVKPSSHRVADAIVGQDDAELVKAVITGKNPGGSFVNFQATTAGNFKMSLEELESGVSSNSNSQLNVTQFDSSGNEIESQLMDTSTDDLDGKYGLVTASAIYGRTDGTIRPMEIDASTHVMPIISYEHHETHEGSHYFIAGAYDLPINNVYDLQFTTPNTTKWTHLTFSVDCESETQLYIYEGASIVNAGTTVTPRNNDRNSSNTSGNTVASQVNTSVGNANVDTPVAGATLIWEQNVGSGRSAGATDRGREIILKQNTVYCLRAVATSAGYVSFQMDWYEHTNKT